MATGPTPQQGGEARNPAERGGGSEARYDYMLGEQKARFERKVMEEVEPRVESLSDAVRAGFERLKVNEGYMRDLEIVKKLVRENAQAYFDAILNRLGKEEMIRRNTHHLCDELKDFVEHTTGVIGSVKMHETPYSPDDPKKNFLEHSELVALKEYFEQMKQVDTDELVDMVNEDQAQIRLLDELLKNPKTYIRPDHPDFNHIVHFVLGEKEHEGTERSDFRKQAEQLLRQELIRSLTFDNKADLVAAVIDRKGKEGAHAFIAKAILTGAITRREVRHMLEERGGEPGRSAAFEKLGTDEEMEHLLRDSVKAKVEYVEDLKDYVRTQQAPPIQNAVSHFVTFNNIAAETAARCGALTCIVGGILKVSNAFNRRNEEGWTRTQAFAKGVGDALKDKWVLGGAAVAAASSNVIWPWWKDVAYGPSSDEQEQLWKSQEERFLREQAEDHEELLEPFVDMYEELFDKAKMNQNEGPIDQKGDKVTKGDRDPTKRSFDLWPHDIEITPEVAGKAGYPSVNMAKAAIIRMFNFMAKQEKKTTAEQVIKYLRKMKKDVWRISEE